MPGKTGNWHGWPTKDINPVILTDDAGRAVRIRTPVMDLEGLITPTSLHYTVQHFAVPPVVETDAWWTGVPLAAVLHEAGLTAQSLYVRAEGNADDPNKELITTIGVKSIITQPNDDTETLSPGIHMIRGYAWSGAGAIDQVEVGVDGGDTWHAVHPKRRATVSCGCAGRTAGMRARKAPTGSCPGLPTRSAACNRANRATTTCARTSAPLWATRSRSPDRPGRLGKEGCGQRTSGKETPGGHHAVHRSC